MPDARFRWLLPLIHVPAFLFLSLSWALAIGIAVGVWVVASGRPLPSSAMELLGPTETGVLTIVQIVGFGLVALLLALFVPLRIPPLVSIPRGDLRARLDAVAALHRTPWPYVLAAGLGGLVVWTLPSWTAEKLMERFPGWPTMLQQISEMLHEADLLGRIVLVVAIVVSAPLVEELIFRGYLWRVLELGIGRTAAFIGSTLLFAMYHVDPIHVVSLLPTALFLGWLRLRSRSLVPPILAHFANNGLAVALTLFLPVDPSAKLALPVALGGLGLTLALAALAELTTRRFATRRG